MNAYYTSILINQILEGREELKLVGVSGCMGAGKTTFCENLLGQSMIQGKKMNYINLDKLVKTFYTGQDQPSRRVLSDIQHLFGKEIFNENILDKNKLANIIFNNPLSRERLAEILIVPLLTQFEQETKNKADLTLVDVAYFTEYNLMPMVNYNFILVGCDELERRRRILNARNINPEQLEARINSQHTHEEKRRLIKEAQEHAGHGFFYEVNTNNPINCLEILSKLKDYFHF
jgi:dephospho-CoA kinase